MGLGVVGLEPDRLAVLGDRLGRLPLGVQGEAEVVVGLAVVGLEPDRLAVFGDGLVPAPLSVQGVAEVVVGHGVVGLEPDRLAARGDRPVEHRGGLGSAAPVRKVAAIAAQVAAVVGPAADQVAQDRLGLRLRGPSAPAAWASSCRPFRPQAPGRRVGAGSPPPAAAAAPRSSNCAQRSS